MVPRKVLIGYLRDVCGFHDAEIRFEDKNVYVRIQKTGDRSHVTNGYYSLEQATAIHQGMGWEDDEMEPDDKRACIYVSRMEVFPNV